MKKITGIQVRQSLEALNLAKRDYKLLVDASMVQVIKRNRAMLDLFEAMLAMKNLNAPMAKASHRVTMFLKAHDRNVKVWGIVLRKRAAKKKK